MSAARLKKLNLPPTIRLGSLRAIISLLLYLTGSIGCQTTSPPLSTLPGDGSVMREGQAVWTSNTGAPSVAGELLLITSPEGSFFVQFSKPPFNLVTARSSNGRWYLELQNGRKQNGSGQPPPNFLWFQLARAVTGRPPDGGWRFTLDSQKRWVLNNPISGETLEGYFSR